MNDRDRVADRRVELSLPIVEGTEQVPDLTEEILARLRAEGLVRSPSPARRTWIAAAVLLLGTGVAIGVALQRWAEPFPMSGEHTAAAVHTALPGLGTPTGATAQQLSQQDPGREGAAGEKPGGNSWFETTDLDLGTVYQHEKARGIFRFRNPTGETQRLLNIRQSCHCTKARFRIGETEYYLQATSDSPDVSFRVTNRSSTGLFRVTDRDGVPNSERVDFIVLGPGEEGTVEVEMEMMGIKGLRSASIQFQTSDPDLPFGRLDFHAIGASYFTVTPDEINLDRMLWNDRREFTARVTSPVVADFNIVRLESPADMNVSYEKVLRDGRAEYTITGTYGPLKEGSGGGGRLVFHTDQQDRSFTLPVVAFVEGPIRFQPGEFLSFGRIPWDQAASRSVRLESTNSFELRVERLEARELSFDASFLEVSAEQEAQSVRVTLRILPGIPRGTVVRGDVVIHLNHPAARTATILFNGFIR